MKIVKASSKNIDEIVNVEANCGYHKNPVKTELKKLFVDFYTWSPLLDFNNHFFINSLLIIYFNFFNNNK